MSRRSCAPHAHARRAVSRARRQPPTHERRSRTQAEFLYSYSAQCAAVPTMDVIELSVFRSTDRFIAVVACGLLAPTAAMTAEEPEIHQSMVTATPFDFWIFESGEASRDRLIIIAFGPKNETRETLGVSSVRKRPLAPRCAVDCGREKSPLTARYMRRRHLTGRSLPTGR